MANGQQTGAPSVESQNATAAMIAAANSSGAKVGIDLKYTPRRTLTVEDRQPPSSVEAEQGALGCVLLGPQESMPVCIQKLKTNEEVFYDPRHQVIYKTLLEMYDKREPIDIVTLVQKLRDNKNLDAAGGMVYISSLADATPSVANLEYYLAIVKEKYLLRKMIRTCAEVISNIYSYSGDVEELLDDVESKVLRVSEERVEETVEPIKSLVLKSVAQIEQYFTNQGATDAIRTGFPDIDKLTLGLHPGDMIVIAARPSVGKTSLAMNIAEHVAVEEKQPVGVFSLEMTAESLVLRMICSHARVNLKNVREGFLHDRDFSKITTAASKLSSSPLFIDDTSNMSILELRAKARRMAQQYGIKLFVIDYLQLLHSNSFRAKENRQQEIAEISRGIKSLAKELNVPIIVLSQLNREVEKEKNRKPRLSDLRESGAIEQDADVVGLLYQANPPEEEGQEQQPTPGEGIMVNLSIAKQRNGPTGDISLIFLKQFTRFESLGKDAPDDVPVNIKNS
ncbi:MAG: replicative DNA helicase [Verrucomicrobiia bacterium]